MIFRVLLLKCRSTSTVVVVSLIHRLSRNLEYAPIHNSCTTTHPNFNRPPPTSVSLHFTCQRAKHPLLSSYRSALDLSKQTLSKLRQDFMTLCREVVDPRFAPLIANLATMTSTSNFHLNFTRKWLRLFRNKLFDSSEHRLMLLDRRARAAVTSTS